MGKQQETSRSREIVKVITSGIQRGTITAGERLPSQVEMAELFGVSRTVVREAVKVLEGQGIVSSKRGSGIYVNPLIDMSIEDVLNGDNANHFYMKDILEVGRQLWYQALDLVVRNASNEEIEAIANATRTFYKRFGDDTDFKERYIHETSFGLTLTKYSHNPLLHKIMVEFFQITSDVDYEVIADNKKYREILEIDLKVAEALEERNSSRAVFYGQERDRVIERILVKNNKLLEKTYHVRLLP
ncbi:FadR/GntR family transcriptional regulator [Syntrophomonas curvata]